MKVLWKCTIRFLKENKLRTIITIIGVAMATALFMAITCLCSSLLVSMIQFLKTTYGTSHARYEGVAAEDLKYFTNNQSLEQVWLEKRLGYFEIERDGVLRSNVDYFLDVRAAEEGAYGANGIRLASGRFPENDHEIIIDRSIRSELGIDVKIGDLYAITLGKRMAGGNEIEVDVNYQAGETLQVTEAVTYEIVGFVERDDFETRFGRKRGPNYDRERKAFLITAYTYLDPKDTGEGTFDVSVRYTLSGLIDQREVSRALLGISKELYDAVFKLGHSPSDEELWQISGRVKRYQPNQHRLSELETLQMLHLSPDLGLEWAGPVILVELLLLVIMLAGVFCINNSFDLSITQRIRFFGMLGSVGATRRQRRILVWLEAMLIGAIGIPLGLLCGLGIALGLVEGTNWVIGRYLKSASFTMYYQIAWWGVVIALVQAILMLVLSAMEAASRATGISPMAAIRANDSIKSTGKKKKTPMLIKKLLGVTGGIAWQSFQRSKVKYRATITSIAVSVALVLGMTFIPMLFDVALNEMTYEEPYQVLLHLGGENAFEIVKGYGNAEGVIRLDVASNLTCVVDLGNRQYFFVYAVDDASFKRICDRAGVDFEKARGKGIALDTFSGTVVGSQCVGRIQNYSREESEWKKVSVEIAGVAKPTQTEQRERPANLIYVGEDWRKENPEIPFGTTSGYFLCEDASSLVNQIYEDNLLNVTVYDLDQDYQANRLTKTIVILFLFGFLGMLIAIGVTNVINAVRFNLELRTTEFAVFRSIGMTEKQIRTMIHAEGLFLGIKGLLYGMVGGLAISYGLYRFCWEVSDKRFSFAFQLPWKEITCSVTVVSVMLFLVMNAYAKKTSAWNVIETIRKENL